MRILAIDTSCDETAIAILKINKNFKILSNNVSSQVKIHQKYGGVFPALAKREHQKNLLPILERALGKSRLLKLKIENRKIKTKKLEKILEKEPKLFKNLTKFLKKYQKPKVDLIAVTVGPGLEPCLWVGVNFAKALAFFWNLKILPINHIEAHLFANWQKPIEKSQIFPAIYLVVSGGHTQLILIKKIGKYQILGETRDDAAGECFDKVAKILGLDYPGGPEIAKEAAKFKGDPKFKIKLPRPMINQKNYDFSFSGLKTAVFYDFKNRKEKERESKNYIQELSNEVEEAVSDVLVLKTLRAAIKYRVKSIILGGGVVANLRLREKFEKEIKKYLPKIYFLKPEVSLCTDNALMVGICSYFHWLEGETKNWKKIKANANARL